MKLKNHKNRVYNSRLLVHSYSIKFFGIFPFEKYFVPRNPDGDVEAVF